MEVFAEYGNAIGGLVVVICLVAFLISSKILGTDERADAIFSRTYKLMFTILAILILGSIFFGIGSSVSGKTYQNLIVIMFAISFLIGNIYLLILSKKY
ncbi:MULTISPECIES: hypothetical protein [Bacillaceae]|uniref:hypothetical protein n=1 Tax=Bacillaceae TaxID=186817 RepID=UPI001C0EFFAA|nr:hypothetical protein [Amphibacillus sp. MSJ-3]MBU5594548.1 hypothetical protein [Amphibacillus sp. MSJ-3]